MENPFDGSTNLHTFVSKHLTGAFEVRGKFVPLIQMGEGYRDAFVLSVQDTISRKLMHIVSPYPPMESDLSEIAASFEDWKLMRVNVGSEAPMVDLYTTNPEEAEETPIEAWMDRMWDVKYFDKLDVGLPE